MTEHLIKWKMQEDEIIELNFENDWQNVKEELLTKGSVRNWKKIMHNKIVVEEILPILFPTRKYKEILIALGINN